MLKHQRHLLFTLMYYLGTTEKPLTKSEECSVRNKVSNYNNT